MSYKIIILDYLVGKGIKDAEHSIVIESKEALDSFLSEKKEIDGILGFVIPAELKWGKRYFTDFGGLEIIYKIRLEYNLKVPIIVTSFIPSLDITNSISNYSPLFRCLQDPSIKFLPIEQLYKMNFSELGQSFETPINDDLFLEDINNSIYDKRGYVLAFLNATIKELRFLGDELDKQKAQSFLFGKWEQLKNFGLALELNNLIDDSYSLFLKTENFHEKKSMISFCESIKGLINEHAPQIENFTSSPIEVLYIGDDLNLYNSIVKKLDFLSIFFRKANNSSEAIQVLTSNRKIKVITSEFRFLESDGKLSREQGYHIIKKITREVPRIYSSIILTSKELSYTPRFFSNQKVTILKKDELFRANYEFINFGKLIYEQNLWVNNVEKNLPDFGEMLGVYIQHINKEDYEAEEKMISDFALNFIKKIIAKNPEIDEIQNIAGKVVNDNSEKSLTNLRIKLKARRVLLGLYQLGSSFLNNYNTNKERWSVIYSLLKNRSFDKHVSSGTMQPFLSKHLIKIQTKTSYHWTDINNIRLTPKEREWLLLYGNLIEKNAS